MSITILLLICICCIRKFGAAVGWLVCVCGGGGGGGSQQTKIIVFHLHDDTVLCGRQAGRL